MKKLYTGILTIEKIAGKGGWTYVRLPFIKNQKNTPFGWLLVDVTIDHYSIENYHLMPMGNGHLFLPIKAAIRKALNKTVGDQVSVSIVAVNYVEKVKKIFSESLSLFPTAEAIFNQLSKAEQTQTIEQLSQIKNKDQLIEAIKNKIIQLEKR
jgi:hypothetical protein